MRWLPPWLGRAYGALYLAHRTWPFAGKEAPGLLGLSAARSNFALSRLASLGWAVRVDRGRYQILHPEAVLALDRSGVAERFEHASFYPTLQVAASEILRQSGPSLVSLTLYGSCARLEHRPESDVDLLVVLETLPTPWSEQLKWLRAIRSATRELTMASWIARSEYHVPQVLAMDRESLAREPVILLDLTEDAQILFDPDSTLATTLDRLRGRLKARGSRRIWTQSGRRLWNLTTRGSRAPIEAL